MADLYQEFSNSRIFHNQRIERRTADELCGLAAGITSDGLVNQSEAEFLRDWIEANALSIDDPVINLLFQRLTNMLEDGVLDSDEATELLGMLHSFNSPIASDNAAPSGKTKESCTLPLNNPVPDILVPDKTFLFTGVMAFGPRKLCEQEVLDRGGKIKGSVSKKIDYLVIGTIANDQWLNSSYGTKIKRAMEIRDQGAPLAIVSENHWSDALFG